MPQINWIALIGGALTLLAVAVSVFVPWWQLSAGENLLEASISPFNMDVSFLGTPLTIALIGALNLTAILTFAVAGIVMLIYSVVPTKPYAKHLVGFAYSKPLAALVFFVVLIFGLTTIMQSLVHLNVPLAGSAVVTLPTGLVQGVDLSVSLVVTTAFQWPFWLAVIASGVCIVARLYHRKFAKYFPPPPPPPVSA